MNPSYTSNSKDVTQRVPKPTKAAIAGVLLLLLTRAALMIVDAGSLTHIDSRRVQSMLLSDLKCEAIAAHPPEVVLLGTSRAMPLSKRRLARLIDRPENEVVNLSSLGADFVIMEMILRRNPGILENAKVVIFDVMPMQVMKNHNYDERGEFFLRFSTLEQRLNARGVMSKAIGIGNFLLPISSYVQNAYQWRTGFKRMGMNSEERHAYLREIPLSQFGDWTKTTDRIAEAERAGKGMEEFAELFFVGPDVVPNQVHALRRIIEMTPDTCTVILVWLPFRDDVRDYVAQSKDMTESRDQLKRILEDIDDPKVELHWFERPEDMGLNNGDYMNDGAHFGATGVIGMMKTYADLIKPHL